MSLKFITPNMHGVLDFTVAAVLIVAPLALGLGAAATTLSVLTGAAVIVLSLLTDYRFGLARVLPFWVHLTVDGIVAAAFLAVPAIFGLTGLDAGYFWVMGAGVLAVVATGQTTQPTHDTVPAE